MKKKGQMGTRVIRVVKQRGLGMGTRSIDIKKIGTNKLGAIGTVANEHWDHRGAEHWDE